jgi:hypothetical protein
MRRTLIMATCLTTVLLGSVSADIITQGLELAPSRAAAELKMNWGESEHALIRLQVGAEGVSDMKGFGFILSYDPTQYAYIGSEESDDSMISPNGTAALMVHKNHEDGRVAVGAVQVDGSSASGAGNLVELTFERLGPEFDAGNFQLTEGILVDLAGKATEVQPSALDHLVQGPVDYGLHQNVPNPFNPETTISYSLPNSGRVLLTVYTSLGQEVRTLIDDVQEVGAYTIRWDGRDSVGRQVASGVYFYRMHAGDFSDTKRMMLLK